MATINFKTQHIDEISPNESKYGGVNISCDMDLDSMLKVVAEIRGQISEKDWEIIVSKTDI